MKGLDEVRRKLDKLERNVKAVRGTHEVNISELLTSDFMRKHSRFGSIEDFMIAGDFLNKGQTLTKERFRAIPDQSLDEFVSKETDFPNWKGMIQSAAGEYTSRRLFDGI